MENKETETVKTEEIKTQKNNYVLGAIGATLAGIIATIPWILVYVYGGMMLSVVAVVIGIGELLGYRLFKGKVDKKTPIITTVIAVILITIATLVVIPLLLVSKEGINVNTQTLSTLYADSKFVTAILTDWLIATLFTLLGTSVVNSKINSTNDSEGNQEELKVEEEKTIENKKDEAIKTLKPIFTKANAVTKANAIMKEEIFTDDNAKEEMLKTLKSYGIVKKYSEKYYYIEQNESKQIKKSGKNKISVLTIIIGIIAVLAMCIEIGINNFKSTNTVVSNSDVSYKINSSWGTLYEYTEQYGWDYYKYINSTPLETEENNEDTELRYENYPATINVYYQEMKEGAEASTPEELKTLMDEYFNELEADDITSNTSTNKNGYNVLSYKLVFNQTEDAIVGIEFAYYIFNDKQLATISGMSYNLDDEAQLEAEINNIANSFKWNK